MTRKLLSKPAPALWKVVLGTIIGSLINANVIIGAEIGQGYGAAPLSTRLGIAAASALLPALLLTGVIWFVALRGASRLALTLTFLAIFLAGAATGLATIH